MTTKVPFSFYGESAAATKIRDGLKEEELWSDYDEGLFKKYVEGQQP
jgi:hypothetical protein